MLGPYIKSQDARRYTPLHSGGRAQSDTILFDSFRSEKCDPVQGRHMRRDTYTGELALTSVGWTWPYSGVMVARSGLGRHLGIFFSVRWLI